MHLDPQHRLTNRRDTPDYSPQGGHLPRSPRAGLRLESRSRNLNGQVMNTRVLGCRLNLVVWHTSEATTRQGACWSDKGSEQAISLQEHLEPQGISLGLEK